MSVGAVLLVGSAALGSTLVLDAVPWFGRPDLASRLGLAAGAAVPPRNLVEQLVSATERLAAQAGRAATSGLSLEGGLRARLGAAHRDDSVDQFRFRQVAGALVGGVGAMTVSLLVDASASATVLLVVGAPTLAVVAPEIRLRHALADRRRDVFRELPQVAERAAMHLAAGRSLTVTINLLASGPATRTSTADMARVDRAIGCGDSVDDALGQWADAIDLPAVRRLTDVLRLHRHTPDIAVLVRREADAIRSEVHRDLLATIDRRSEQVWIPVTVSALLPGAILLLVPFLDALRRFGAA